MNELITTAQVLPETLSEAHGLVTDVILTYGGFVPPVVEDAASYAAADAQLGKLKADQKKLEAFRKAIKAPYDAVCKSIQAYFAKPGDLLESAERQLKNVMRAHLMAEEEKRKRYEAELNAKEAIRAELFEEEARTIKVPEVCTSGGSASIRRVVRWRIVDESKIPREYLIVDEKKLNQLARWGGNTKIPGVEFYEEQDLSARAAKPETPSEIIEGNA